MGKRFYIENATLKEKVKEFFTVKDIFIVYHKIKDKILYITDDNDNLINYYTKGQDILDLKEYRKLNLYHILEGLNKNTCKYRTDTGTDIMYIKYNYYTTVYNNYKENGKNMDSNVLYFYKKIKDKKEIKVFF